MPKVEIKAEKEPAHKKFGYKTRTLEISYQIWVCEEDYKPMLIHTVFWIGNTIGCFIWGFTNDL